MSISKNTRILVLMVLSQLMLVGLSVHWLIGQFRDEKSTLYKEIEYQFTGSIEQVTDTLLVKHLIRPAIHGNSQDITRVKITRDSITNCKTITTNQITVFDNHIQNKNSPFKFVKMPDSIHKPQKGKITLRINSDKKKDMLLKSVKLIINEVYDTTKTGNFINRFIPNTPDTILLKKVFSNRIQKKGFPFPVKWIIKSSQDTIIGDNSTFYFETGLFENYYGAEISNYNLFLMKRISSQILFIIILLITTASAFFMTYKNMKKMETLNILRNEFISNISHELKTPVSTVKLTLEVLKNFDRIKDPVVTNEYLDIAFLEMNRLDQLISKVLNTSVLESKKPIIFLEKTNLKQVVDEVLRSMQLTITKRNAEVIFKSDEDEYFVNLDKLYILGVIINLLDNSLKYGPDLPKILINLEQSTSSVILTVSDNGPGIPDEFHSKVFDKFFRVPTGDLHNVKGYGLGLSFAAQVMKHHQGSIHLKNLPEGGCMFSLYFPKSKI
jgi:signal transduction histidine kinase